MFTFCLGLVVLFVSASGWGRDKGRDWSSRGGPSLTYGIGFQLVALSIPNSPFVDRNPASGDLEVGRRTTFGIGGGLTPQVGAIFRKFPGANREDELPFVLSGSLALSLNVLYVRPPKGTKFRVENGAVVSKDVVYDNRAYAYLLVPLRLGGGLGLGSYRSQSLWRGSFVGLNYVPTLLSSLEFGKEQDDIVTDINPAGVELYIDIVKLDVDEARNTQLRFSGLLLPRVNDDLPWLVSLGLGAVWY